MWKLFQQKSSKMKIASQESCQLNQNKSSTLNRTGPQEFDNLSSYTLPRGVHYKSSTLPPPPPSRTPTTYSSTINKSRPSSIVTMSAGDDSCAINELLEGRMYLTVILPPELANLKSSNNSGNKVVINVERRTPMMDILVNIATQYKFNASKYRIHVDGHNFKASTPIGSLDVNTVAIVSKPSKPGFRSNDNLPQVMPTSSAIYQIPTKQRSATLATPPSKSSENSNHLPHHQGLSFISNVPFKPTFRLQVNLPRNQLMVLRVSPESSIGQIKAKICEEKELDPTKYQLTAKDKELLLLDPIKCLADYGIHEVSLISNNLLTKVRMEQPTNINGNINHSYQNQDQMTVNEYQTTTTQAVGKLNKPIKKRPAPLPPSKSRLNEESVDGEKADKIIYKQSIGAHREENHKMEVNEKVISCNSHLRQDSGSDSSGYHESLASSESPRPSSESVNQQGTNLNCRNKLNDKEVSKKVITKKRKAPLPPNLKNGHSVGVDGGGSNCSTSSNKSEIGESIDCLSDVSVPLSSSSSGSSRRSDYRMVNGRDSSLHGDETSFTLVSGTDDLDDIGTLKGSDSAPIPSPDSGTCSHVPLDEEKGSDGMASAPESAIMGDSAIGDTIVEEADIELEEQSKDFRDNLYNGDRTDNKLSRSSSPLPSTDESSKSCQIVDDFDENTLDSSESSSVNHLNDSSRFSVNEISSSTVSSNLTSFDEPENNASVKSSLRDEHNPDIIKSETLNSASNEESHEESVSCLEDNIQCPPVVEEEVDNCKQPEEPLVQTETPSSPLKLSTISLSPSFSTTIHSMDSDSLRDDKVLNYIGETTHNGNSTNVIQKENLFTENTKTPTIVSGNKSFVKQETEDDRESLNKMKRKNKDDCLSGQEEESKMKVFSNMTRSDYEEINTENNNINLKNLPEEMNENVGQSQEEKKVSSKFVRDLCRPRVRLTNFKIGSYQQINNVDIYQTPNVSKGIENCISNDVSQDGSISANERPKSLATDTVKPVIVTASLKNGNTSACNEFGSNNMINSNTKISMIAPQPFKLNRLASWSGTDTKSFRQAYSNISNIVENRETIAEKAEKIEKVLRIERPIDRIPRLNNGFTGGHRCVSQIEINGDSAKVSIRNTLSPNENDESPIQVTTFVKSEQTPLINNNQIKEAELQNGRSKQKQQINKILPDSNTKLEIIKTVKSKTEPISSRFGGPSIKSMETRSLTPKVPVPILPSFIPQPPPPPPPPMPNTTSGCKKIVRSVPKFKKTNSSTSKTDFHDALLNEIRACGGRGALRKVNIHR
ncbi:uncharacterized protein LOC107363134 isoform X2 [Tetranychus urticae]|uniref:uncharacterized protein LOC107363134 isoform X2 n=1 Tax=Tetranychus urticae TaxID=32264 RepID=UPI00077BD841|nr:uncharacterized protein LOC107363134 isoform X2 [Tetranychus urticae]